VAKPVKHSVLTTATVPEWGLLSLLVLRVRLRPINLSDFGKHASALFYLSLKTSGFPVFEADFVDS
jgi:hypothetical protein